MNNKNTIETWTNRLSERPELFPHQLDLVNDRLLLAEISADEVKAASFLDQRVLKQTTRGSWVPWAAVENAMQHSAALEPARFIFHVGHCGSTLLSRLLGFAENTLSLREPLPLRTLAQDLADSRDGRSFLSRDERLQRLKLLSKLWCRGARHTVIKATSICTDLLPLIHNSENGARSVFMFNRSETHIATLLAGQNALTDLKGFGQLRIQRLQQLTGLDIHLNELSPAQLAALSWLSETTSAANSIEKYTGHIASLEFESLLQHPVQKLAGLLEHFGIAATAETVQKAVESPVLQSYSKAPEHRYNAQTRADILKDSRARFQTEIQAALTWIEEQTHKSDLVAMAVQKFG